MSNRVFIATSLDGYIAASDGNIDWLETVPNPENKELGYSDFISDIDALVMGRTTYETVLSFDIPWPYDKPVYVLSNKLREVPEDLSEKVFLVHGNLNEVLDHIHSKGHINLYIDGGRTIQGFLQEDLIDELTITVIPILLGGGHPLFGDLSDPMKFELVETSIYLDQLVSNHYRRIRS